MQIKKFLKNLYDEVDYLPVASSIKGLGEIAAKAVAKTIAVSKAILGFTDKPTTEPADRATIHRVSYLKNRSTYRCLVLLVPVFGNLAVAIYDYNLKENTEYLSQKEILEKLKNGSLSIKDLRKKFTEDREFMKDAIKINPDFINYASKDVKENEYIQSALQIMKLSQENNQLELLKLLKTQILVSYFYYVSSELQGNAEFMKQAMQINARFVHYASDELKTTEPFAFIIKINEEDPDIFLPRLDRAINPALKVLETNHEFIIYLPPRLKEDLDFMKRAIKINPRFIEYASEELKKNEYLQSALQVMELSQGNNSNDQLELLSLLKKDTSLINYLSLELKKDPKFMFQLIENNYALFDCASIVLKNNRDFVLKLIENNPNKYHFILRCLGEDLKNSSNFILQLINLNFAYFQYIGENLKKDSAFISHVFENYAQHSEFFIAYVDKTLKNNDEFMHQLINKTKNPALVAHSESLRSDALFMVDLIKSYKKPELIEYVTDKKIKENIEDYFKKNN